MEKIIIDNIDNETFKKVDDIILDEQQKTIESLENEELKKLKADALNFIASIKPIVRKLDIVEQLSKEKKKLSNIHGQAAAKNLDLYKKLHDEVLRLQNEEKVSNELYRNIFSFREKLNKRLSQKIIPTLIFQSKDEIKLYEISDHELFEGKVTSNYKVGVQYPTKKSVIEKLIEEGKLREMELDDFHFDFENLKLTRNEVVRRFEKTNKRVVFWKSGEKWGHAEIINKGDIDEAYASIVLLNRRDPTFKTKNMEIRISQYINNVVLVDNESGFLAGDVQLDSMLKNYNKILYEIKSANFGNPSALGYEQVIGFALNILNTTNTDVKNILEKKKKELHDKSSTRNKKYKPELEYELTKELQDLLKVHKANLTV